MTKLECIRKEVGDRTLVAVTKTVGVDVINRLVELGVKDIGENRVQSLRDKLPFISKDARVHFIGPLQRNKVKYLIGNVYLIQSVHSLEVLEEIQKRAQKASLVQDVLLQVNLARENVKQGFYEEELKDAFEEASKLENIRIKGFMMMAPLEADEEELRGLFKRMKELFDYYNDNHYNNVYMKYLSMGMSNDYQLALQCGSNMVRIGRKIVDGGIDE